MIFFGLLLLLFAATSALCFFDGEKTRTVWCTFAAVATLLFLLAAFRPVGLDQDSENYVQYYYGNTEQILEFTFTAISALVSFFADSPRGMFVVYALLGILLHTWAVTRSTPFWLLALVVWMGNFDLYQEVTQIRVAVAAGLFLVGLSYLAKGEKRTYLLFSLAAACFHYSAFVLPLLTFFGSRPLTLRGRLVIGAIPLLGYLLFFGGFDPIASLPIPWIQEKLWIYERLRDSGMAGDAINVFNIVYVMRLLVFYLLLWKYDVIKEQAPNLSLLLKVFAISYFCFTALGALPVMAFRYAELFGVVEIVMVPYLALTMKPEAFGKSLVIVFAFGCMMLNVFYNELLKLS